MEKIMEILTNLTLMSIVPCAVILVVGLIAVRVMTKLFKKILERTGLDKSLHKFLTALFKILLTAIVILIAASSLGIDVTSLIAVLSVASLAISLAVQDSLANVAGGIMVLTSRPFSVGDYVEVGGNGGTVQSVGLAYTSLKTADSKIVYVPNKDVASSRIVNYSREDRRRVDLTFTASYNSPVDAVIEALTEAASQPQVLEDTEVFVRVKEYNANDIGYTVRVWVKNADYWTVYFNITKDVKRVFDEKGIEMSYPHTIVHLEK